MSEKSIPVGFCQCGCGRKTEIAKENRKGKPYRKGEPKLYIRGHIGGINSHKKYTCLFSDEETKMCKKCKSYKSVSEFNKSSYRKDRLRSYCKSCDRKDSRDFYKRNPEPYKKRALVSHKKIAERNIAILDKLRKENGCVECGEKTLCCLDFHHIVGNSKGRDGGQPVTRAACTSMKQLRIELSKCVILCTNCHRKVHEGIIVLKAKPLSKEEIEKLV